MEGARDERRRQQGEERHQLHRDVADQEVDSVSGPTRTKRALLGIQRKQALQRDENDGEQHDVQDEPVEPDPERRRAAADFDGASAGKDRRHTEEEAGQPEPLGRPQQDIEGRKQKTCDDRQRQDHAHGLDGIARRRLRGGQPIRIAEHKHGQKTSQAEEHSEHTGQPTGPEVLRQAVPEEGFHPPIQLGLAVWRLRRVRLVGGHVTPCFAITLVSHVTGRGYARKWPQSGQSPLLTAPLRQGFVRMRGQHAKCRHVRLTGPVIDAARRRPQDTRSSMLDNLG